MSYNAPSTQSCLTEDKKLRFAWSLAVVLLFVALLSVTVSARPELRLVTVPYRGLETLHQLVAWGLQIMNYQGDVLAALCSDAQIERLRQAGFQVSVLDWAADPQLYYLAYLPPLGWEASPKGDWLRSASSLGDWESSPLGDNLASLSGIQAVYPYGKDVYIVKATPAQAAALTVRGIEIVKLPNSVILPRRQATLVGWPTHLEYSPTIQAMVDAVSSTLLIHHVCKLQDDDSLPYGNELGSRYSYATAKLDEAAQYLYHEFTALGLSVAYDAFQHNGILMTNVVAELPGGGPASDHIYILCAHYDSTSKTPDTAAPGADDNASGSAAVLEAARILSQYHFKRTLRFVLFAGEEQGLFGSEHYALQAWLRGDLIDGVINLDMIGYESVPPNDHIVEIHAGIHPSSIALADALIDNISEYSVALVPQKITSEATHRSDHGSFWNYGYPAILGIEDFQDFNPYYHTADDTLAHMQTSLMVEFTKASVATLAELASRTDSSTPTPTCTATLTATPTLTGTVTPTATRTPTGTATPTATLTPTSTATPSATPTSTHTATPLRRQYLPIVLCRGAP